MAAEPETTVAIQRPRIRVRDARKSFAGRVVVDVDDVVFGESPIEGLIGPNGAGKTTLMRMIMHSIPLDTGTITLDRPSADGAVLSSLPASRLAGLGVVKSNQVIMDFDKLTIWDSLLLSVAQAEYEQPWRIRSERTVFRAHEEEMRHYLEYFGFDDPTTYALSAGEKKVLDIIRCLLLKPRFLLLDEPTAGLPDDLTAKIVETVRDLAAGGTTVVVVEHDLNVIWNLCDRVLFMAEGKIALTGAPAEIREHHTVIEKYLGEGHV
jgi:ABC-type branched-subunit amino acid transport system ATPase component